MPLPDALRQAIEQEAAGHRLTEAAADLSDRYRSQQNTQERFITTDAHRLAYAAVRAPATFAAVSTALSELHRLTPRMKIESLLDLGAGTGAASWAAAEVFDGLGEFTLVEQDSRLIELGRKLAQASGNEALRAADWRAGNLRTLAEFPPRDLILFSYSLGEIEAEGASKIIAAVWPAAREALVIVEPGTTKGFEVIRRARAQLIEAGAFIVAPCPHVKACPMPAGVDAGDWCHFAARFERSPLHRRLKGGTLGYEDEKFSYIAVTKQPVQPAAARVVRHPLRQAGRAQLQLCAPEGLQTIAITKRDKEDWRRARKTDWGDAWDIG